MSDSCMTLRVYRVTREGAVAEEKSPVTGSRGSGGTAPVCRWPGRRASARAAMAPAAGHAGDDAAQYMLRILDSGRGVVDLSVTRIDLDDEVLAEARRLMGAPTKGETVNGALRDYVSRSKRLEAAEKLAARGERGEFEVVAAAHAAAKRARRAAFE